MQQRLLSPSHSVNMSTKALLSLIDEHVGLEEIAEAKGLQEQLRKTKSLEAQGSSSIWNIERSLPVY